MSDEPEKEEDLLTPLATLLGCVLLGAQMPRTTKPGEDLLADGMPELGIEVSSWAPGGRLWLAKALRDLGDALAVPEEPRRADADPVAGADLVPQDAISGRSFAAQPTEAPQAGTKRGGGERRERGSEGCG
jgi:hypothetical protein